MYQYIISLQKKSYKAIALCLILLFMPNLGFCTDGESLKCLDAIGYYEGKYNIPRGLLHSIAMVESGRWSAADKRVHPWPWAVNTQGQAHYFPNQQAAIHFVKTKLSAGVKNIDVGCNQVSLLHHGHRFPTLEHAFDPHNNSRYAAEFLQANYNESKNWITAVGWYHSKTQNLATPYIHKVHKTWRGLRENSYTNNNHALSSPTKQKKPKGHTNIRPTSSAKRRQQSVVFVKR